MAEEIYYEEGATFNPQKPFDAASVAQMFKKSLKGMGTDTDQLTKLITGLTNFQRQQVAAEYQRQTKRNLISHIKSDTSGKYEDILVALMTPAAEYDAQQANKALKGHLGFGVDNDLLVEILSTRSPRQIQGMKAAYRALYKTDLVDDINKKVSPDVREILAPLASGTRDESTDFDPQKVKMDAESLFKTGLKTVGAGLPILSGILSQKSYAQLRQIFNVFQQLSGRSIEDTIKTQITGKPQKTLATLVSAIKNPTAFFADKLHHSVKGIGTNEDELIRVLATRSEVDLPEIKQVYGQKYGRDLEKAVRRDVHGKFQDVLVALLRGNLASKQQK